MKRRIILAIIFTSLILGILFSIFKMHESITNQKKEVVITPPSSEIQQEPTKSAAELKQEEVKSKIERIRKKIALKGLIKQGDIHSENQEYTIALTKYLQIQKELPDDPSIIQKIGDTFYNLQNYSLAYKNYKKISDYEKIDTHKVITSLLASRELTPENINYFKGEISQFNLSSEEAFYYSTSLDCISEFSLCKQAFGDYFEEREKQKHTGSGETLTGVVTKVFEPLEGINTAIQNYRNFKIDDVSYKSALVIGSFYTNQMYPIAIAKGNELLVKKNNYGPVLKIIAKSYFELGKYKEAKKVFLRYNAAYPGEKEISFALGVIYQKLGDYVISGIHLKKALNLGYKPKINILRRLVYNYNELGNVEKTLKYFNEMIENGGEALTAQDYSLAIYHHLIAKELGFAEKFTTIAISKYPDSELFYGYMSWIELEKEISDLEKIEKNLTRALEINQKSAMINLLAGNFALLKGQKAKAVIYYKKTQNLDKRGEFGELASATLESLQSKSASNEQTK